MSSTHQRNICTPAHCRQAVLLTIAKRWKPSKYLCTDEQIKQIRRSGSHKKDGSAICNNKHGTGGHLPREVKEAATHGKISITRFHSYMESIKKKSDLIKIKISTTMWERHCGIASYTGAYDSRLSYRSRSPGTWLQPGPATGAAGIWEHPLSPSLNLPFKCINHFENNVCVCTRERENGSYHRLRREGWEQAV